MARSHFSFITATRADADQVFHAPLAFGNITVPPRVILQLKSLPAPHLVGQAVLLRTAQGLTTMVTIAEAALTTLGEDLSALLWIILKVLEISLRARAGRDGHFGYCEYRKRSLKSGYKQQLRASLDFDTDNFLFASPSYDGESQDGEWRLHMSNEAEEMREVKSLLDWLTIALGDEIVPPFATSTTGQQKVEREPPRSVYNSLLPSVEEVVEGKRRYIRLKQKRPTREDTGRDPPGPASASGITDTQVDHFNCWRDVLLEGNILVHESFNSDSSASVTRVISSAEGNGLGSAKDGLYLTAAAMWSMLGNDLRRIPGCFCTFTAKSGHFLQCKIKIEQWLLWHVTRETAPCDGTLCNKNLCVATDANEPGERLLTTTPCILGWEVEGRSSATSALWDELQVSADFTKRPVKSLHLAELQAVAQLSVPLPDTPQIGAAATFAVNNYVVNHSIESESRLAMEEAAAATVLIYDERRQLHLLCDGADIMEVLCLQYIRELGLSEANLPLFTHTNALGRLQTWYQSAFISLTGTRLSGDLFVRKASERLNAIKRENGKDVRPMYWLLEDLVQSKTGQAYQDPFKSSRPNKNFSTRPASKARHPPLRLNHWQHLALDTPPILLTVGNIEPKRLTKHGHPLERCGDQENPMKKFFKDLLFDKGPGLLIADFTRLRRWRDKSMNMTFSTLDPTGSAVKFGPLHGDIEKTYKFTEPRSVDAIPSLCSSCANSRENTCVHCIE
ncbi:uncharacterized protein KY384_008786 [Bacidia gigantensis]|uniref:uncharacterized protein n=1 Tax=Bacidia gigantensis TaxID=2732470 RepID=UPI001D056E63|nr:uncharacterized protein KY384_008786 [Bacidia gigantensis]KAG8526585.1 hypothetical protein KY384_008786 [Bacidia gigantensis]